MGHEPSTESQQIRDAVLESLKLNPQGLPPGEIAKLVFDTEEVDNNDRQRVQYWVASLTNSKNLVKKGLRPRGGDLSLTQTDGRTLRCTTFPPGGPIRNARSLTMRQMASAVQCQRRDRLRHP